MKLKYCVLALSIFVLACAGSAAANTAEELAGQAVSGDTATSVPAIRELRSMGYAGLDALFAKYAADIERFSKTGEADENWKRIANAIDTVAMQKDAYTSQLYWYTDLDEAKRAAKAANKPILTLRLLGNLNEEFSCANSRLFRTILYTDPKISKYLRENYILHWKSVRPAPRITIDFGDGRKIERTITGNSIHYIIDSDANIIDAIPGLYNAETFLFYLMRANEAFRAARGLPPDQQALAFMKHRKSNFARIVQNRNAAIEKSGVKPAEPKAGTIAILAAPMAMSKAIVVDEYSILRVFDDFAKYEPVLDLNDWTKLSAAFSPVTGLNPNSVGYIRRQNRTTGLTEAEFTGMFSRLETFVSIDTTRNEFLFHGKLYEWLNQTPKGDLEELNARVYDQIFKTPNSDKWLGLYSSDVYTALDGNGIVKFDGKIVKKKRAKGEQGVHLTRGRQMFVGASQTAYNASK